jgi:hypothetical protein
MADKLFCSHCNEVIQKICTKCDYKTDERIHIHDLYQKTSLGLFAVGFQALDLFPTISLA